MGPALACRFFKRFDIPDLERAGCPLSVAEASMKHANNTLLITVRACGGMQAAMHASVG